MARITPGCQDLSLCVCGVCVRVCCSVYVCFYLFGCLCTCVIVWILAWVDHDIIDLCAHTFLLIVCTLFSCTRRGLMGHSWWKMTMTMDTFWPIATGYSGGSCTGCSFAIYMTICGLIVCITSIYVAVVLMIGTTVAAFVWSCDC